MTCPVTEALGVALDCDRNGTTAARILARLLRDFAQERATAGMVRYLAGLVVALAKERGDVELESLAGRAVMAAGGNVRG